MFDSPAVVQIKGVRELRAALKQVDDGLAKELRDGLAEVAAFVAGRARPKVPTVTGAAAGSIKARKQGAAAALAVGGAAAPYFPWLDFGGRVGRHKSVSRPFLPAGRYIYPALAESGPEVERQVDDVISRLSRQAGF